MAKDTKLKIGFALIIGPWIVIKGILAICSLIELFQQNTTAGWIAVIISIIVISLIVKGFFMIKDYFMENENG